LTAVLSCAVLSCSIHCRHISITATWQRRQIWRIGDEDVFSGFAWLHLCFSLICHMASFLSPESGIPVYPYTIYRIPYTLYPFPSGLLQPALSASNTWLSCTNDAFSHATLQHCNIHTGHHNNSLLGFQTKSLSAPQFT